VYHISLCCAEHELDLKDLKQLEELEQQLEQQLEQPLEQQLTAVKTRLDDTFSKGTSHSVTLLTDLYLIFVLWSTNTSRPRA
jgi:DNA-binding transcriptional regulator YbjK